MRELLPKSRAEYLISTDIQYHLCAEAEELGEEALSAPERSSQYAPATSAISSAIQRARRAPEAGSQRGQFICGILASPATKRNLASEVLVNPHLHEPGRFGSDQARDVEPRHDIGQPGRDDRNPAPKASAAPGPPTMEASSLAAARNGVSPTCSKRA